MPFDTPQPHQRVLCFANQGDATLGKMEKQVGKNDEIKMIISIFCTFAPKLIHHVNLRNRDSCGRHPDLYRVGAVQRVFGQVAAPFVLGVVRHLAGHPAAVCHDCGADILQRG